MTKKEELPKIPTSLQTGEEVKTVEIPGKQPKDLRYAVHEGERTIGSFAKKADAQAAVRQLTGE